MVLSSPSLASPFRAASGKFAVFEYPEVGTGYGRNNSVCCFDLRTRNAGSAILCEEEASICGLTSSPSFGSQVAARLSAKSRTCPVSPNDSPRLTKAPIAGKRRFLGV